jgi:hypothetical protein
LAAIEKYAGILDSYRIIANVVYVQDYEDLM